MDVTHIGITDFKLFDIFSLDSKLCFGQLYRIIYLVRVLKLGLTQITLIGIKEQTSKVLILHAENLHFYLLRLSLATGVDQEANNQFLQEYKLGAEELIVIYELQLKMNFWGKYKEPHKLSQHRG